MGRPSTYSMTKYGRPSGVVPPSSSRAMFGWVRFARICRSCWNRRITASVSRPCLTSLTATSCWYSWSSRLARYTTPIPPWPISRRRRYCPMRLPSNGTDSPGSRTPAFTPARGPLEEGVHGGLVRQQRFHLTPQHLVAGAGGRHEDRLVCRVAVDRRLNDFLETLAAFRIQDAHVGPSGGAATASPRSIPASPWPARHRPRPPPLRR